MRWFFFLLFVFSFSFSQDLYTEFIKSQVKEIPLNKAIVVGKGKNELISFINPDCGHCRKEWKALRPHLDKVKIYVFLLPFKTFPESYAKSNYIACSKDKLKALDEVLSGKFDGRPPLVKDCPLVQEHIKVAEKLNVQGTPYNIILKNYKVIEGYSPALLKELGIQ
ncbi:MAG: DsbC family protein [Aquificota bacterium]|jgi:protein disulfide-isomerase/thiol:disulfide interchange protein DsbC|nr:DsbC family protein [Aquificaceae bacterium]QWK13847.1 MAG: DsbC family protein [Aquificota bacterium]HCO39447.1 protein-disulfide isomerase [Aquificaceae bacterium]